ncbi:MAG: GNAT family N-acetyltransferase [Austwickia sp.]|jgi:ribosomal protein S18 acetylase RimI-like enzyme|nr:GNAT family N-acetyltransferase [Austwickia sp.]MBK8436831.1 GNAT family N-acetyltransferase [Austwickia sp.]MBK9100459.1 GNAT family N-acetyltransferase [Austwickia sp.]
MTEQPPSEPLVLTRLRPDDVPALAAMHRRAFSGFFLAQLGEPFLREFYRGFLADPTAITVVARDGGVHGHPVGVAVGTVASESFYRRLLTRRWYRFAAAGAQAAVRDPAVVRRLVRAVRFRGDTPTGLDAALFASMCVAPESAGRGVGHLLANGWADEAHRLGATRGYLTTDRTGNDAVNRFHVRHGWYIESQYTTPEGRAMNRYVIDLPRAVDTGPRVEVQAP